jgi:hypothetical protein
MLLLIMLHVAAWAAENPATFELVEVQPRDGASDVPITASLSLRFSQPVAADSLLHLTLHRIDNERSTEIRVRRSTDLTGASVTLSPEDFLEPGATYEIRGSTLVKAKDGAALKPFRARFTTSSKPLPPGDGLVFTADTFDTGRSMTTVLFGPDRRLCAADALGTLVRWDIADGGKPSNKQILLKDSRESRQYIDLEWDPKADAKNLILWVSYAERLAPKDDRHYFTGTIARLEIAGTAGKQTVCASKSLSPASPTAAKSKAASTHSLISPTALSSRTASSTSRSAQRRAAAARPIGAYQNKSSRVVFSKSTSTVSPRRWMCIRKPATTLRRQTRRCASLPPASAMLWNWWPIPTAASTQRSTSTTALAATTASPTTPTSTATRTPWSHTQLPTTKASISSSAADITAYPTLPGGNTCSAAATPPPRSPIRNPRLSCRHHA